MRSFESIGALHRLSHSTFNISLQTAHLSLLSIRWSTMSLKSWPGMTMPSTTFKDDAKSTVNEFVGTVRFVANHSLCFVLLPV